MEAIILTSFRAFYFSFYDKFNNFTFFKAYDLLSDNLYTL